MKHYTFKIHFNSPEHLIEGGSVGETFEHALLWFKMQPQVQDFIRDAGPIKSVELVSEESLAEATPEAARAKGMHSLAAATQVRIDGENNDIRKKVGNRIKDLRTQQHLSQQQLADLAGVTKANICNIERGAYSVGLDILNKIATALHAEIQLISQINQ